MSINLKDVQLPKKISPCPILESIVEIRFDSHFPSDAIFGIIYNEFKTDYPNVQELPILQLPEIVRKQDPILKYKPYYKLSSDDKFLFQVGARTTSLINLSPYSGWGVFSGKIKDLVQRIKKLEIVSAYSRVGIRYRNGFDCNILEKINLSLNMTGKSFTDLDSSIRLEVPTGKFISTLQIANNAQVTKAGAVVKGSVIDIDTYIENPVNDIIDLIESGHSEEKKLFYTLLKKEFIEQELNPEY